jgi:hypothetical protein
LRRQVRRGLPGIMAEADFGATEVIHRALDGTRRPD